jgi:hypothetical protein
LLAAAFAGLAGLADCTPVSNQFPPACPRTGTLGDASDITRYRPGGRDLTDLLLDGRITGVNGSCTKSDRRTLAVSLSVSMLLVRGPAAGSAPLEVPFFVAVSRGGEILDKQVYRVVPAFEANSSTARVTSDPINITLPIGRETLGSAYDVVVGFQLSPEELALNRRRGPR